MNDEASCDIAFGVNGLRSPALHKERNAICVFIAGNHHVYCHIVSMRSHLLFAKGLRRQRLGCLAKGAAVETAPATCSMHLVSQDAWKTELC